VHMVEYSVHDNERLLDLTYKGNDDGKDASEISDDARNGIH
jgi:hypothetical protein